MLFRSSIGVPLVRPIMKWYGFAGFGVAQEVFSGRIRLKNAVQMHSIQLEALFKARDEIYKPGSVQLGARDH